VSLEVCHRLSGLGVFFYNVFLVSDPDIHLHHHCYPLATS
jgi:hypothetical protein